MGRLRRATDFARVYRQGRPLAGGLLAIRALPLPAGEQPNAGPAANLYLAVVASKRLGGAVVRNRIRRRVREAVRRLLPRVQGRWALVALPRREAAVAEAGALQSEIELLLRKGRVIDEGTA